MARILAIALAMTVIATSGCGSSSSSSSADRDFRAKVNAFCRKATNKVGEKYTGSSALNFKIGLRAAEALERKLKEVQAPQDMAGAYRGVLVDWNTQLARLRTALPAVTSGDAARRHAALRRLKKGTDQVNLEFSVLGFRACAQ